MIGSRSVRWPVAVLVSAVLLGALALIDVTIRYANVSRARPFTVNVDPRFAMWLGAIESRDFDAAQGLLDDGFSVDASSEAGEPASFIVVRKGDSTALKWLLERGADPEGGLHVRGEVDLRLLQHAIRTHCDECVMLLLDRGANVRPPLVRPRSLLHDAFGTCASDEVIAALLDAGADRDPVASDGSTLLHSAGCERAVRLGLEWGIDPNAVCRYRSTPLHQAARTGCVASVTLLIEAGARIDVVGPGRNLPLHYIDSRGRGQSQEWLESAERAELVRLLTPERMRPRSASAASTPTTARRPPASTPASTDSAASRASGGKVGHHRDDPRDAYDARATVHAVYCIDSPTCLDSVFDATKRQWDGRTYRRERHCRSNL